MLLAKCDFCSSPAPAWNYPAESFKDPLGSQSIGDWLACEECHALIEAGNYEGLARRALAALGHADHLEWSMAYCRDLYRMFRENRTGPPQPIHVVPR